MTKILNFRCDETTKKSFKKICSDRRLCMTSVLNQFVMNFIEKYDQKTTLQKNNEENSMIDFYFYNSVEDFQ